MNEKSIGADVQLNADGLIKKVERQHIEKPDHDEEIAIIASLPKAVFDEMAEDGDALRAPYSPGDILNFLQKAGTKWEGFFRDLIPAEVQPDKKAASAYGMSILREMANEMADFPEDVGRDIASDIVHLAFERWQEVLLEELSIGKDEFLRKIDAG